METELRSIALAFCKQPLDDFNLNFSYLIFGTAFVEDGNSICAVLLLLLDFEAKTTASEKQNTPRECQRPHIGIHSLPNDTLVLKDFQIIWNSGCIVG